MTKQALTPPDPKQCQAEKLSGSFMTLGPRSMERCTNKPTVIVTEVEPGEDGECGSMSLCDNCLAAFRRHDKRDVTVKLVENTTSPASASLTDEGKFWEIWSEGYAATGESAGAHFHGTGYGPTFKAACTRFFAGDPNFDCEGMTHWACKLFDNETQARRTFG